MHINKPGVMRLNSNRIVAVFIGELNMESMILLEGGHSYIVTQDTARLIADKIATGDVFNV